MIHKKLRLDLNNPIFQKELFQLEKQDQHAVLNTLRKISKMSWNQIYDDIGLKWEVVYSRTGPNGERIYSVRVGKKFRALSYRDGDWLRLLSLHPDHDSAY